MNSALPNLSNQARKFPMARGVIHYDISAHHRVAFCQSTVEHSPKKNQILAALPAADYQRVLPHLELMELSPGSVLHEAGRELSFAYFPTAGIVSPLCRMEDGTTTAVAIIGNEGVVGTSLFLGGGGEQNQALVQSAGHAYRLSAARLKEEFNSGGYLCQLLLRYAHSLITQMAQTAACNRCHSVEQQLCRWLLLSLDRTPTSELCLTHELLANMLGVRREGITQAAGKLQEAGAIRYRRGHISVPNHGRLEERVCECYRVIKAEFNRCAGKTRRHLKACV